MKGINFLVLFITVSCASRIEKPVATIDSKDYAYRQCYNESEAFKDTNVKGHGQVKIGFTVLGDGKVDDEKILSSDFKDPNFHSCLLEITRSMKFPLPKNGEKAHAVKILNFSSKIKMNY